MKAREKTIGGETVKWILVPESVHHAIKMLATSAGKSISDWADEDLRKFVKADKVKAKS